eukprot:Skav218254  [mRNA]  locus=scaffold2035:83097:97463:- [translate_table: standard]
MTECWICLRSSFQEGGQARQLQLKCGHTFHEACLLEVQDWLVASSTCPACADDGRWSASGLCKVAAVEYLRAIRSTAPETPARFVVTKRCWGYLNDAMTLDAMHSKSMVLAGVLHQSGLGTERNEVKAFEFFSQAHSCGDALGTLHLARCYKKGSGCGPDTYRARQLFAEADAAGNVMATLELALMNRSGLGGEKNLEKTMELFQKAHEAGDALAAFELGKAYMSGNGLPKDAQKARECMKAAHDRGYTLATVELGQMYLAGIGGPRNPGLGQELLLAFDFPPPKPKLDEKSLLEGWLTFGAADLYQAEIGNLNKDRAQKKLPDPLQLCQVEEPFLVSYFRRIFQRISTGDEGVTKKQLHEVLEAFEMSLPGESSQTAEAVAHIFNEIDHNADEKICWGDFYHWLLKWNVMRDESEDAARSLFTFLDRDGNGTISPQELMDALMLLSEFESKNDKTLAVFQPDLALLQERLMLPESVQGSQIANDAGLTGAAVQLLPSFLHFLRCLAASGPGALKTSEGFRLQKVTSLLKHRLHAFTKGSLPVFTSSGELKRQGRSFTLIFRTFGSDLPKLQKELL